MTTEHGAKDPLEFMKGLWSQMGFALPGMVAPTLDVDEIEKRITDLKAVEGWLKMNLNMLQMTIQGLEVQRATLAAMRAMGESARNAAAAAREGNTDPAKDAAASFNPAAMWPWNLVQPAAEPASTEAPKPASADKPRKGGTDK